MNDWLCRACFELEDEALELHIQAHARQSVWSYDEVKQAVMELRAQYQHCVGCQDRIDRDLRRVPNPHHNPPGRRAMDFNGDVPVVPVMSFRGYGKTKQMEDAVKLFQAVDLKPFYAQLKQGIDQIVRSFADTRNAMREAGVLPEEPPTEPKARALWLRQNRNTGPARPSGPSAKRPRRHK